MKRIIVAACIALCGCQTVSDVAPIGKDTYIVGSNAYGGFTSDTEVAILGIRRANEFCEKQGQYAQITDTKNSGVRGWTPLEARVTFHCATEATIEKHP